jgi:hypothetical protein
MLRLDIAVQLKHALDSPWLTSAKYLPGTLSSSFYERGETETGQVSFSLPLDLKHAHDAHPAAANTLHKLTLHHFSDSYAHYSHAA